MKQLEPRCECCGIVDEVAKERLLRETSSFTYGFQAAVRAPILCETCRQYLLQLVGMMREKAESAAAAASGAETAAGA